MSKIRVLAMVLLFGCSAFVLALSCVGVAQAQGELVSKPAQLTIAGTRGEQVTRTLLLQATDVVTGLQIVAPDLLSSDGLQVLPSGAIQADLPDPQIAVDGLLAVPLTFDLAGVRSGEFSGELLIRYRGGSLGLPVTVKVKDGWLWPLLVLCLGVIVGGMLSVYRSRGRPRDEIVVRVDRLQQQVKGEKELSEAFSSRIESYLVDVERALQVEEWRLAQETIKAAEALWDKWQKRREDWVNQLSYGQTLLKRLEELDPALPYVESVYREVDALMRGAAEQESPDALRGLLDALTKKINRYVRLQDQLDEVDRLLDFLPPEVDAQAWATKVKSWQHRLDALDPSKEADYQSLNDEIAAGSAELRALSVAREPVAPEAFPVRDLAGAGQGIFAAPPDLVQRAAAKESLYARMRLRVFTFATYGIALVLLAGAGFGEMYMDQPTFGARPWADYFGLLAWGFGAEATRAAIADAVRRWGISHSE